MTTPNLLPDVCRSRHGGNAESEAANKRVHHAKFESRTMIYEWFLTQGSAGATCEACSRDLGVRYTTASARISELKRDRWLVPTGRKHKTSTGASAAVLRAVSEFERSNRKPVQLGLLERVPA